jgi:amino acid adenylation domain-containing protein
MLKKEKSNKGLVNKTIQELFESQVKKTSGNIAVQFEKKSLTYAELNARANKLAYYLRNKKIGHSSVVGIAIDKSIDQVIASLGVLKAGCCCLFLGTDSNKRKSYILKNSNVKFLLVNNDKHRFRDGYDYSVINIKDVEEYSSIVSNPANINKFNDLACLIYTSGSTGKPKGVMMPHRGVINSILHRMKIAEAVNASVISSGFPVTLFNLFTPLFSGAKLVIYSENICRNAYELMKKADRDKVDYLEFGTPSMLRAYFDYIEVNKSSKLALSHLKVISVGGEKLNCDLANLFFKHYKNIKFWPAYGQSENSMTLSCNISFKKRINKIYEGKPGDNMNIYILDEFLKEVAVNKIGELYVGGQSLFLGYLNNLKETKKALLPNPFSKGKKIYKTGDLARIDKNGNIEILGRIDDQIKINGYRVEPQEIEITLSKNKYIKEVIVLLNSSLKNNKDLIAYYTTHNKRILDIRELKKNLKKSLPYYMVPKYFIQLKFFPRGFGGKIDRKALPKPKEEINKSSSQETQNEIEKKVLRIWREVLKINNIGLNDDFFDIGGNSLKIIEVANKLGKIYPEISVAKLFSYSTIFELSNFLNQKANNKKRVANNEKKKNKRIREVFDKVEKKELSPKEALDIIKSL